jgi:hypothetical protein
MATVKCMGVFRTCSDTAFFPRTSRHRVKIVAFHRPTSSPISLDRLSLVLIPSRGANKTKHLSPIRWGLVWNSRSLERVAPRFTLFLRLRSFEKQRLFSSSPQVGITLLQRREPNRMCTSDLEGFGLKVKISREIHLTALLRKHVGCCLTRQMAVARQQF